MDTRGTDKNERVFSVKNGTFPADPPLANQLYYNDTYAQDDRPAREMRKAGGHAVRAMYFYTAMADIAREYGDEALEEACTSLWDDSVNKKMYITGGVSAERFGEAIGTDYVLPNDYAYAETCASVAMANFSQRMFRLKPDGKYMDMIERQMYNGALSGLSMDGKGFFYDNALQCRPEVDDFFAGIHALPLLPPYRRQEVFECSCCPLNIYRFIAALGQYFYSAGDGKILITVEPEADMDMSVAVRIPGWCLEGAQVKVNGDQADVSSAENGYVTLVKTWHAGDTIELYFPMKIMKIEGNPKIVESAGKIAIVCGPLVYCVEGVDNGFDIFDLTLGRTDEEFSCVETEIQGYPIVAVKGKGMIHQDHSWDEMLYRPYKADYKEVEFTAIPYFSWCNRDVCDMTVWIRND